jgi:hypothetical protein
MANRAVRRALDDKLPEWKYLDLSAPHWALRHSGQADSDKDTFVGVVYTLKAGDVASVVYLFPGGDGAAQFVKDSDPVDVRELETDVIQVSYCVRRTHGVNAFFKMLFQRLGLHSTPFEYHQPRKR